MRASRLVAMIAGGAGAALVLASLMGPTVTGLPSSPTFQRVSANAATSNARAPIQASSALPELRLIETDQAADAKQWDLDVSGSQFFIRTRTDAGAAGNIGVRMSRSGTTVSNVTLTANANTFDVTNSRAAISSTAPNLLWNDSDAGSDEKFTRCAASGTTFFCGTRTDADGAGADWLTVTRSGTTVSALNLAATSVTINGSALPAASSGTFVASFETACSTTPTITFDWTRAGDVVVLFPVGVSGFTCTGDSTSFISTSTPVPAAIRPSTISYGPPADSYTDNSANTWASMTVLTDGNLRFNKCTAFTAICSSTGWTAGGNRGAVAGMPVTYMLGNP